MKLKIQEGQEGIDRVNNTKKNTIKIKEKNQEETEEIYGRRTVNNQD